MNKKTCALFAVLLLSSPACFASSDSWSMQINGTSYHSVRGKYNEDNRGLGLERDWAGDGLAAYVSAGTLINSMSDRSWYIGGGHRYAPLDSVRGFTLGYFAGAITYPSSGMPVIPVILPMIEMKAGRWGINSIYLPKVMGGDSSAAVLFQIRAVFN